MPVDTRPTSTSQRALLVGRAGSSRERWNKMMLLDELTALTRASGGEVVERLIQVRPKPDPATLVGRGMAERLRGICAGYDINLLVFDDELTPTQQRNLERICGVRVIDRVAVILDIFALHARTAEAKAQVELAQLEYQRPRLTGRGTAMSRLGGGIGTRGPGETQLEVDRRRLLQRIVVLRRMLQRIEEERLIQRRRRRQEYRVALAGYTNAGKSALFNALTGSNAVVSSQVFATLDASTRLLRLGRHRRVLLTDTIGFIRSLPPQLVASFRATLGEIREADLVLHVVDASADDVAGRIDVVNETLNTIGAGDVPRLLVFNKVDLVIDMTSLERFSREYPGAVFVSALTGSGVDGLKGRIAGLVGERQATAELCVPHSRPDIEARIRSAAEVIAATEEDGWFRLRIRADRALLGRLQKELEAAMRQ